MGGKYRLIAEIGRGGMGSVWRAEHLGWKAPVAIKVMTKEVTERPEAVMRFEREVRLAAGLRSPHVVQVLDHGIDEATQTPFIAMELLEGESLARRLRRETRLSPAETFRIVSHLVRALSRAHAAGIVHRDLKPDNVFLVQNEEESLAKVLDFGVAKWTAPTIPESGLTRPGSVLGTPFYMSPEQIQGLAEIDHRADLWSLSAIACECLTGKRPFEAHDFAQLAVMLLSNTGRPLPSSLGPVPSGFDAWFLRATAPNIAHRFQTAREMAQSLAPLCGVSPASLAPDSFPILGDLTSAQGDHASMAGVSRTASRIFLGGGVWRRPWAKFVASTAVGVAVVGGGITLWYRTLSSNSVPAQVSSPIAPGAGPSRTATAATLPASTSAGTAMPSSASGERTGPSTPGVRIALDPGEAPNPRTSPPAAGDTASDVEPARMADPLATEEPVRSASSNGGVRARPGRTDAPRAKRPNSKGKPGAAPARNETSGEPEPVRQAPAPRATAKSTKAAPPESAAGSTNVDGRRIRTSLTPNP